MEKIFALIDKLQELKNNGADLNDMTYYTQLLFAELMCAKNNIDKPNGNDHKKISVIMPGRTSAPHQGNYVASEEKPVSVPAALLDEEEPDHEVVNRQPQPVSHPQPVHHSNGISTSVRTKEINEIIADNKPSLNDLLKTEKVDLATKLTETAGLKDLSKAIDINDKFLFINDLFRGDRNMFDRSIKTINECDNLEDAAYWIERELKVKLGWQENNDTVKRFYTLVRKRFV